MNKWIVVMRGLNQAGQRSTLVVESEHFDWHSNAVIFYNDGPETNLVDVVLAINETEVLSVAPMKEEEKK